MSDAPEIALKTTLSGSDEVELAMQRIGDSGERSYKRIDAAARQTTANVQTNVRSVQSATVQSVQASEQQVGLLSRVAGALGDAAGYVSGKVQAIATGAAIAGTGLAAAFTAGYVALGIFADKSAREGEQLLQLAKASGISVEALTRYQYAADIAAGSSDNVAGAFKRVSDLLIRFQDTGSEDALGPFIQVGLGADVAEGKLKTAEQVFARLGDQLKAIPDPARRAKAAFDLLGGGAKDLLPVFEKNAGDLKALQAEAVKLGETKGEDLTKNTKLLEDKRRLSAAIDSLKDSVADAFFPVLAAGAGNTAKLLNDSKEKIDEFIYGAADKLKGFKDDLGKLFSAPVSERVSFLSFDGEEIDLTKERLRNLVQIGREAGEAMEDADDEDEEAAGASAMRRIDLDQQELESFIKVGNTKIVYDENLHKKFIEIDGKRVEVSKSNGAKILSSLADTVSNVLDRATSSNAKALRFNSGFLAALYEPAQELRKLGLDVFDALSGKGLGERSATVRFIEGTFRSITDFATQARDAALGLFGLTASDLPTFSQAFRAVQRTFDSFRQGLSGEDGKAPKVAWAASVGSALRAVGQVLVATYDIIRAGAVVAWPYLKRGAEIAADAFLALRDVIRGGDIDPTNTFAGLNAYLPTARRVFEAVEAAAIAFYEKVKAVLAAVFTEENWERLKTGAVKAFDIVSTAVETAYERIKAVVLQVVGVMDTVAKALGFKDWKELGITLLIVYLTSKIADLLGLGFAVDFVAGIIKTALINALVFAVAGFVALTAIVSSLFGIPALAAAGIVAALAGIGVAAYKYSDEIKAALGGAADWVRDKWTRLKSWFTGDLLPAFGIGEKKVPEADVPMPAQDAAPEAAKPQRPTQYVLGTDGTWRSEEEEDERTGTGSAGRRRAAEETARLKAQNDNDRRDRYAAMLSNGRQEGEVGAERVMPGMAQSTFADFRNSLRALGGGLSETTPFAKEPLAVPQGGAANLVPFAPTFQPSDGTLYGTKQAVDDFLKRAADAGIVVKTPRPREM